ncbi:Cytochrome c [Rubripirellula amarantea]|uniref:Cytochrome c n=1 Tax=Rubripirellula amarantea TaxID=2527999 RepID=A0A5C5WT35_9BACT|nr:PVC-type heme-binding CxxCH protein [Rubripirellula amarantea]TWT52982.1 Cytochrome c [Rubripirellula amarantea]
MIRFLCFALSLALTICSTAQGQATDVLSDQVQEVVKAYQGQGVQPDDSQPTSPDNVLSTFTLDKGIEVDLVAHEPGVEQPLFLTWDSRGRMWVVEYRQYQYPAGLKVVKYDQYLRAVFDKTPAPPPKGTQGLDRITVLEDTNHDGTFDRSKVVIEGLNIATSVQVGRGGIWVLNPPYLLFYPDADGDDVPDSDPEVHLSGFGLQDTHSVANSLTWGIDGWLYGANGSTTGGTVRSEGTPEGVSFEGQCIWRYHPESKRFEIFAEGGGNTFSVEIDSVGRIFSGTNWGNTRGLHYPQGAYFIKNWGKHGPLTNPHAYGYFEHMKCEGDSRRFAQAFTIYEGGLFDDEFQGSIIAPNSLHNVVWRSKLVPVGSTYRTVDQANLMESSDRWFRPVYAGVGPDGAIYMADWYDTRLSHLSPIDNWHKDSGRLYRVRPQGTSPRYVHGDLHTQSSDQLLQRFDDPNRWVRQRAVLELSWRGDDSITPKLIEMVDDESSIEALWVLHALNKLTPQHIALWVDHDSPHIRRWIVRLCGDDPTKPLPSAVSNALAQAARHERDSQVRVQYASTAKRVDPKTGMAIVANMLHGHDDSNDLHLPMMLWWAVEHQADDWDAIESWLSDDSMWSHPLVRQTILSRLMQRYASTGSSDHFANAARLLAMAPDDKDTLKPLLEGINRAFQGRAVPDLPQVLADAMKTYRDSLGQSGLVLAIRQGDVSSHSKAIAALADRNADAGLRMELASALSERRVDGCVATLLDLATAKTTTNRALQRVAIASLANFDEESVADRLLQSFQSSISNEDDLRATACRTLASRLGWATKLLEQVNQWHVAASDVPPDAVQRMRTFDSSDLSKSLDQAFGKEAEMSGPEKKAMLERMRKSLSATRSSASASAGKVHFDAKCANCHQLFGEGKLVGPALDGYQRSNPMFWLPAIIEPSLEIREGYQSYRALTFDGQVITGMIAQQSPETVTLKLADGLSRILDRDDLEIFEPIPTSLMPEGLLDTFSEQELADLFAYLSRDAK